VSNIIRYTHIPDKSWSRHELCLDVSGSAICQVSVIEDEPPTYENMGSGKGGINVSSTGTVSPQKARQIIKMIELALDLYEGNITVTSLHRTQKQKGKADA